MEKKPLKRSRELRPFSIDHHHGLLLCWKIRTGLKKGVGIERISVYVNWFYTNYLLPHFELEEQYLFPVLDSSSNLIKRALEEHRIIRMLMKEAVSEVMLEKFAGVLEAHIRFEERVLFEQIQKKASPAQITAIENVHGEGKFEEKSDDEFWK